MESVNVDATAALIDACRRQGVRRLVYVSSIAARYPDTRDYPYGAGKQRAEALVRESGLNTVIIRPTIVLGRAAPNWLMLRKLANLPIVPLIGGGKARVQPVDVADVVAVLLAVLKDPDLATTSIDVGGPEVLTFAAFLRRIRIADGKRGFKGLPMPVWPLRQLLRLAAAVFGERIPVSPGQLVPFTADGVAAPHPVSDRVRAEMAPLDHQLDELCHASSEVRTPDTALRRECQVFCRYLLRQDPDEYVVGKYVASDQVVRRMDEPPLPVDLSLVAFASKGRRRARIADAYARVFRPHGLLRRKLLMLFAILENSPGRHEHFTRGASSSLPVSLVRVAFSVISFLALLGTGILVFGLRQRQVVLRENS